MTDIALRQDANMAVFQEDPTGGRLLAWAQAAVAANQLAKSLCQTSFVPAAFKGNPGDATATILMGDELGLSPLASLRLIFVIHGQPAMYARTMVALAQSRGHDIWTEKSTDTEVVVCGRRRGSDHEERSVWTIGRAQKAGYTKNAKYASTPQEMLYAKASAEIARKIAADVLAGIAFSVEDLELEPSSEAQVAAPTPATTKVSRARKPVEPVSVPEPDLSPPDEPGPEPTLDEPAEAEELIRPAQMRKLQALFTEKQFRDRDDRLAFVTDVVGVDVSSSSDLTVAQASRVIDALTQIEDATDADV